MGASVGCSGYHIAPRKSTSLSAVASVGVLFTPIHKPVPVGLLPRYFCVCVCWGGVAARTAIQLLTVRACSVVWIPALKLPSVSSRPSRLHLEQKKKKRDADRWVSWRGGFSGLRGTFCGTASGGTYSWFTCWCCTGSCFCCPGAGVGDPRVLTLVAVVMSLESLCHDATLYHAHFFNPELLPSWEKNACIGQSRRGD